MDERESAASRLEFEYFCSKEFGPVFLKEVAGVGHPNLVDRGWYQVAEELS